MRTGARRAKRPIMSVISQSHEAPPPADPGALLAETLANSLPPNAPLKLDELEPARPRDRPHQQEAHDRGQSEAFEHRQRPCREREQQEHLGHQMMVDLETSSSASSALRRWWWTKR